MQLPWNRIVRETGLAREELAWEMGCRHRIGKRRLAEWRPSPVGPQNYGAGSRGWRPESGRRAFQASDSAGFPRCSTAAAARSRRAT